MDVIRRCAGRRRCWITGMAVMLSACAHDPAPKARCHGPWVWVTPAAGNPTGAADGISSSPTTGRDEPQQAKGAAASFDNVPPAGHR